jgi:hypothetical protein
VWLTRRAAGKTKVLTARVAYLIHHFKLDPSEVVAVRIDLTYNGLNADQDVWRAGDVYEQGRAGDEEEVECVIRGGRSEQARTWYVFEA